MTANARLDRRTNIKGASTAVAATAAIGTVGYSEAAQAISAESLVGRLYGTLSQQQRQQICFNWDHQQEKRGLLRTLVANNWNITKPEINDDFYSDEQRELVTDMSSDQKEHLQKTLGLLVEMYRESDQQEAMQCLKTQGGLDACALSFYSDKDLGKDGVWDNWRLEGPSFVWHYRGAPHVHVWVNVADDASVKTNA